MANPKTLRVFLPQVNGSPFWKLRKQTRQDHVDPKEYADNSDTVTLQGELERKSIMAVRGAEDDNDPVQSILKSLRGVLVDELISVTDLPEKSKGITSTEMVGHVIDNPNDYDVRAAMLSLMDQADYLTHRIRGLFGQCWLPAGLITHQDAQECLRAMVEDYVTQACRWHPESVTSPQHLICRTPRFDYVLNRFIPSTTIDQGRSVLDITPLHDRFQMEVLSNIRMAVHDKVHKILSGATWNICFVRRAVGGVAVFIGPDFRALDWERRMESGEWE